MTGEAGEHIRDEHRIAIKAPAGQQPFGAVLERVGPAAHGIGIKLAQRLEPVEAEPLRQARHGRGRHFSASCKLAHREQRDILGMIQQPLRRRPELSGKRIECRQYPVAKGISFHRHF
jgi:hypothetical protein